MECVARSLLYLLTTDIRELILRLRELLPDITLSVLKDLLAYRPDHLAVFLDGLRKAGLPEE